MLLIANLVGLHRISISSIHKLPNMDKLKNSLTPSCALSDSGNKGQNPNCTDVFLFFPFACCVIYEIYVW
jgi:hypothetical protein